jgi:hypothetical protein
LDDGHSLIHAINISVPYVCCMSLKNEGDPREAQDVDGRKGQNGTFKGNSQQTG